MATKKKSPTEIMVENLPKPNPKVQTSDSPQAQVSSPYPAPPIQRVNLNQAATNAILKQDTSAPNAPVPNQRQGTATRKLGKDLYKLEFPDGTAFTGTMQEVSDMRNKYNLANPVEDPRLTAMREADKIQAQYAAEKTAQMPEIPLTGDIPEAAPDALTADILQNINERQAQSGILPNEANALSDRTINGQRVGKARSLIPFNKLTALFPNEGGMKTTILNMAGENKEMRAYLSDYSNYENIDKIKTEIGISDGELETSYYLAEQGLTKEADELFKFAIAKKRRSYTQMKIIADNDQRKYVDDLFKPMSLLESYFNEGGLTEDELKLQVAKNVGASKNVNR